MVDSHWYGKLARQSCSGIPLADRRHDMAHLSLCSESTSYGQEGFQGVTGSHRQAVSSCPCALYRLTLRSQPCCFKSFWINDVATCCAIYCGALFSVLIPVISSSTFAGLLSMLNNSSKQEPSTPHVQGLKWWILWYVYIDSTNNNLSLPSRILGCLDFMVLQVSFVFLVLFDPHFQNNLHSLQTMYTIDTSASFPHRLSLSFHTHRCI